MKSIKLQTITNTNTNMTKLINWYLLLFFILMSATNGETRFCVKNKMCKLKDKIICFNLEEIYLADVRGGGAGKWSVVTDCPVAVRHKEDQV